MEGGRRALSREDPVLEARAERRTAGDPGDLRGNLSRGQRFRLFLRFDTKAKVIIYAWVNDEDTKRTYGSKNDAYAVFRKMLDNGNPPDD